MNFAPGGLYRNQLMDTVDLLVTQVSEKHGLTLLEGFWVRQSDGNLVSQLTDTIRVNYPEDWLEIQAPQ